MKRAFFLVFCFLLLHDGTTVYGATETVRLPITIDISLLRSLIVKQAYTETGEKATVLDRNNGCNRVVLSNPQIAVENDHLRFQTTIQIDWGTPVGENCFVPLAWEGNIVLWQRPVINEAWRLSFTTYDSQLSALHRQSGGLAGFVWDQVKGVVHGYLDQVSIDLAPPVKDMKDFLLPMFAPAYQEKARHFLASIYPEQPQVRKRSLLIHVLAEAETGPETKIAETPPKASPQALAGLMDIWQTMDGFFVHLIDTLTGQQISPDDQQILTNTLLTVRYAFEDALNSQELSNDFIRNRFVWAWLQLEPLFRRYLVHGPEDNILGYLAFFTAGDALAVLDNFGPSMGIEISRDGFYRLAELIESGPVSDLKTGPGVNALLRKAFGLGPPLQVAPPTEETIEEEPKTKENPPTSKLQLPHWLRTLPFSLCATAWAGEYRQPSLSEIRRWSTEFSKNEALLGRVGKILDDASSKKWNKKLSLPVDLSWFKKTVITTAWQESCFRQFHVKNKKITYLLSYNQTSVGVMQVNERVWRGIYDIQKLRWDPRYNALAGSEILSLYLDRYISKEKNISKKGKRFLSVLLYSLYNGGPSQLKKFPKRYAAKKLYQSEKLYLAKLDKVHKGAWQGQVDCL